MLPTDTREEGEGRDDPRMIPHDWNIIHVDDDHDVIYWCSRFDCNREQLRSAVDAAGKSVSEVEKVLLKGTADPPRNSFGNFPKP